MAEQQENRIALFLDLYKQTEVALEEKYRNEHRKYTSVVYEFLRDDESAPIREKLDTCREIRNLLTHSANMDGEPVVMPSAAVVRAMEEVRDYVCRPPLALEYATRGDRIIKANLGEKVLRLMALMEKNGYSHIPVMREGRFFGVFSIGSVFRYQLRGGKPLTESTTLREIGKFLDVGEHLENYEFVPKNASYGYVRRKFEQVKGKNQRVAVIFITENGRPGERLLGMLTPWDVLGDPHPQAEAAEER